MTTSSTTRQRSPGSSCGPSMSRLQAVLLALLAHDERLRQHHAVVARARPPAHAAAAIRARDGDRADRHAADRARAEAPRVVGDELAERAEARGAQDRALGVDVVRRDRAARQLHLADHERVLAQLANEQLSRARDRARTFVEFTRCSSNGDIPLPRVPRSLVLAGAHARAGPRRCAASSCSRRSSSS